MSPASLQCPSVARPNNPLGEFLNIHSASYSNIHSASFPNNLLDEPSERSDRRDFRTVRPVSHPNDSTSELPKPFFVLLASTDKPECRDTTGEFENAYRSGPIMLARIGPPTSRHRPHCRTVISHTTNRHQPRRRPFPIFQKTSRPFSMCLAKTQRTKGTAMNDFSSKLGGKRGSGPLNPLPLR